MSPRDRARKRRTEAGCEKIGPAVPTPAGAARAAAAHAAPPAMRPRPRRSGARRPSGFARGQHRRRRHAAGAAWRRASDDARTPARRLLVMGHIDEIGLIVTHIDDEGYLWFGEVGGWDAQILVGQRVVLDTRAGTVRGRRRQASRSTCCATRSARRSPRSATCTSTSARATARRRASCVRIGDVAVIDAEPLELPNGRLASRALDNRLGSFVALEAARLVAEAGGAAWELGGRRGRRRRRRPSAARARAPSRWSPTRRSSSTSPTPPTRRASTSRRSASTSSARAR